MASNQPKIQFKPFKAASNKRKVIVVEEDNEDLGKVVTLPGQRLLPQIAPRSSPLLRFRNTTVVHAPLAPERPTVVRFAPFPDENRTFSETLSNSLFMGHAEKKLKVIEEDEEEEDVRLHPRRPAEVKPEAEAVRQQPSSLSSQPRLKFHLSSASQHEPTSRSHSDRAQRLIIDRLKKKESSASSSSSNPLDASAEIKQFQQAQQPIALSRSNGTRHVMSSRDPISIPSASHESSLVNTDQSDRATLDRTHLLPSKSKRVASVSSAAAKKMGVIPLENHLYQNVLRAVNFKAPLEVSPAAMVNFINLLTSAIYKYPIPFDPDKCAVSKPLSLDIEPASMKQSMRVFEATPDYVRRFLYECKDYRIVNQFYRHLYPTEDVLTVKLAPCRNGYMCMGLIGNIPAPGMREADGTEFRGRILPAFCDPSINMEIEHAQKAEGGLCFLCIISAVLNATLIRRTQDRDFYLSREDPIVNFYNPTGPGQYNPVSAIYPRDDRPIGLVGPVLLFIPSRFWWDYDRDRGCFFVNQRYYLCHQMDTLKMIHDGPVEPTRYFLNKPKNGTAADRRQNNKDEVSDGLKK